MGQHQIIPLFNLEQGAELQTPVSQESAKTTGLLDICRRTFFFFNYFPQFLDSKANGACVANSPWFTSAPPSFSSSSHAHWMARGGTQSTEVS